ncbi:MAG: adenylate/guanylate cyclase domain-containing protein [Thermodesulfobacteriota bacterium]
MGKLFRKLFRLNPFTITAVIVLVGIASYLGKVSFLDLMELKTIDLRFKVRGPVNPGPEVVLAVIDEKSLEEQGKWMWPRKKIASLIERLSEAGAAVVGLDIGFLEPDTNNTSAAISQVEKVIRDRNMGNQDLYDELARLSQEGDNDLALADSIKNSKAKVVLGYFFQMRKEDLTPLTDEALHEAVESASGSKYQVVHITDKGKRFTDLAEAYVPESNIPEIAQSTDYSGFFNMFPDSDGTVRWMPMVIRCRGEYFAPLALTSCRAYKGQELSISIADFGVSSVRLGNESVPVNESGRLLINYLGRAKTFRHISVTDILENRIPASDLSGRIVLVGATAIGIYDLRVTPFDEVYPGLEIHANVVDNILRNDFLRRPNWATLVDLAAILLLGLALGLMLPRLGVASGTGLAFVLFTAYILLCQALFSHGGVVLNLVYPELTLIVVYVAMTAYKYMTEEAQKRFIKNAFSTYLAPSVVAEIIKAPEKLSLGGEEREITAFFSDVQGFTSISERLTAHALVELLNVFLTEMSNIILEEQGTVDKYEGDAIIAFFGAPLPMPDHAARACVACVKMQKRLVTLRQELAAQNKPALFMRIGLNTGKAVVGNMGSAMRMDYTMMGDTVNTAARLEGVNKIYGTYTMISGATYMDASHAIAARELDRVMVVGKGEPITIYEVQGLPGDVAPAQTEANRYYAKGLAAYRARQFDEASKFFSAALASKSDDGPSLTMMRRCQDYAKNPPPPDWNGAYSMKSK